MKWIALISAVAIAAFAQEYRDPSGFTCVIPPGWLQLQKSSPSGCLLFFDGVEARVSICGRHDTSTTETIEHALRVSPGEHLAQYKGRDHMRLRQDSTQAFHLANRKALCAIFDYNVEGQAVTEWMTWVQSDSTRMHVRVTVPGSANVDEVRRRVQPLLDSIRIP
jgi:hypothetical protein